MGIQGNGVSQPGRNGTPPRPTSTSTTVRCPRRVVLLAGEEDSTVREVLTEYRDAEVSGTRLHAEIQRRAAEHPGACVAAEWLGTLGWVRFLWCRK